VAGGAVVGVGRRVRWKGSLASLALEAARRETEMEEDLDLLRLVRFSFFFFAVA
jgi:hypothetical protein